MFKKSFLKYYLSFVLLGVVLVVNTSKVSAATLNVDSVCTLPKALSAVQNASDDADCIKIGDVYGTSDTVNIPSGTLTLSADLPSINKSITIAGAGKSSTIIDANGFQGFEVNNSDSPLTRNLTIQNLKIQNAVPFAIRSNRSKDVTLANIEVNNSFEGIMIDHSMNITVSSSFIHDNINTSPSGDISAGLMTSIYGLHSTDTPTVNISDTIISGNTALGGDGAAGLGIAMQDGAENGGNISSNSVTTHNVTVQGNQASVRSGLIIENAYGPATGISTSLLIDATTIANNAVIVSTAKPVVVGQPHIPVTAGVYLSGKLTAQQNFTNVTVANNYTTSPVGDDRNTIAGFFGTLSTGGAQLKITNATVVNNIVTQPSSVVSFSAFLVIRVELNQFYAPVSVETGASSQNGLIAHNYRNGISENCINSIDLTPLGLALSVNATPTNLGHNLTDDQSCSGYLVVPALFDTIDHEVTNNGGPVPTIALHEDSPAINAGGEVLGIATDARGVVRPSNTTSVGAYQFILGTSTNTSSPSASSSGGILADTGASTISSVLLLGIIISSTLFLLIDYREHKKPLKKEDPDVDYTFSHHVKKVVIPLMKYRISYNLDKIKVNRT